jgi:hypothetical protein
MADNVGYTPGTGAVVAADEIDGVLFQRMKVTHGVDGTAVDASDEAPLPVLDSNAAEELSRIHNILSSPQGYDRSIQRQRVTATLESGTVTTITTVLTVNTINVVANAAALGGDQAQLLTRGSNLSAWRDCVRTLIT